MVGCNWNLLGEIQSCFGHGVSCYSNRELLLVPTATMGRNGCVYEAETVRLNVPSQRVSKRKKKNTGIKLATVTLSCALRMTTGLADAKTKANCEKQPAALTVLVFVPAAFCRGTCHFLSNSHPRRCYNGSPSRALSSPLHFAWVCAVHDSLIFVQVLAERLRKNATVTSLDLSSNALGSEGGSCIAQVSFRLIQHLWL